MANQDPTVRTCILKVDIKCCAGCQKKACKKLEDLPGVNTVKYDAGKGLMTVAGDVDPMALLHKLNKCGKKTELVTVNYKVEDLISDEEEDDSSSSGNTGSYPDPDPRPMELKTQGMTTRKKDGIIRMYLLLGCFRSQAKAFQPIDVKKIKEQQQKQQQQRQEQEQRQQQQQQRQQQQQGQQQRQQQSTMQPYQQDPGGPPPPVMQNNIARQAPPYFMRRQMMPDPRMMATNPAIHYSGQ